MDSATDTAESAMDTDTAEEECQINTDTNEDVCVNNSHVNIVYSDRQQSTPKTNGTTESTPTNNIEDCALSHHVVNEHQHDQGTDAFACKLRQRA